MVKQAENGGVARMPAYEREQWDSLDSYWAKRANARGTPAWLGEGVHKAGEAAGAAGRVVSKVVPPAVKKAAGNVGDAVLDQALRPAAGGALRLLELANAWAIDLHDPAKVVAIARGQGLDVNDVADLRKVNMKDCDRLLTRHTLRWRTVGAVEGAAAGALSLVPVAGIPASIAADVIVMDVLCTSIATRVAYSYGFDAKDPVEQRFIETVVSTALTKQIAKAAPLNKTSLTHQAFKGRERWSRKLREDHRLGAALEQFMQRWYRGGHVPVQHVSKALWALAILVGAGTNSHTLARVADHSQKYCQTRWLCERYGLAVPPALSRLHPSGFPDDTDEYTGGDNGNATPSQE